MKSMKIQLKDDPQIEISRPKEFKIVVKTMFKDIKENMLLMNEQIGNLSREVGTI